MSGNSSSAVGEAAAAVLEPTPTLYLIIVVFCLISIAPLVFVATRLKSSYKSSTVALATATSAAAQADARLSSAREAAQRVRLIVSGTLLATGWTCIILGLFPGALQLLRMWPSVCSTAGHVAIQCSAATPEQYGNPQWGLSWLGLMWLFPVGLILTLLSLLPTDARRTRIAARVVLGVLIFLSLAMFATGIRTLDGLPFRVLWLLLGTATLGNLALVAQTLRCGPQAWPTRRIIVRLWLSVRLELFALGCGLGGVVLHGVIVGNDFGKTGWEYFHPDGRCAVPFISACLLSAIVSTPKARRAVHRSLGDLGMRGEARSAATVAALVGGRDPSKAMQHALSSFRGLPFGKLIESDLQTNAPDTEGELHSRTVSASLGGVNFFLSHSWHDEPAAKWAALSSHLAKASSSTSPPARAGDGGLLWFDRACINQQKIDDSLSALPIYLAGCRELLVLVGETYTTRLWCVLELFVFLQMGGATERITVQRLSSSNGSSNGALAQRLAAFDALHAQCFKPDDRHRLLAIIEAAFGSFDAFNLAIRNIFAKAGEEMEGAGVTGGNKARASQKYRVAPVR